MAYTKVTGRNFYVYILYRGDWITPFYVGKGCGQRWFVHEKEALRRTCRKSRVIQSMWKTGWYEIPKRKLAEGLTDEEAKALEVRLIAEIGRQPNGPLVNHTDGGDGVSNLSEEAKAKKSAANVNSWADPAVREKRVAGMKRATPAKPKPVRLSHSEASKKMWENPEYRAKVVAPMTGRVQSEETKAKRSTSIKKMFESDEMRVKHAEAVRIGIDAHGVPAKTKKRMENPEVKAAFVAAARTPEVLKKRGANMSANLRTPEGRARRCATMQTVWDARKAAQAAELLPLFDFANQNVVPSENETAAQLFQSIPGPDQSEVAAPANLATIHEASRFTED